jgi:formate dehydrogenase gamma subunit
MSAGEGGEGGRVVRFSLRQRIEHFAVMILFSALVITGLPQKFFQTGWAETTITALGGIERVRLIHRWIGLLFVALLAQHLAVVLWLVLAKRAQPSLVPARQDARDALAMLRYCLGLSDDHPAFDRYDYRQKFEYWGVIFGSLVMAITGFILYFPVAATQWLPGEVVPAAKVAHSNEAMLAFLVIIIWHMYSAHINPDVFPADTSIFTGKISRERMQREHALEYRRLFGGGAGEKGGAPGTEREPYPPKEESP